MWGDSMRHGYYENIALEEASGKPVSESVRAAVKQVLDTPIADDGLYSDCVQVKGIMPVTVGELPGIYKQEVKFCLSRMSMFPIVIYGNKRFVLTWTKIRDLAEIVGLFDELVPNEDIGL